MILRSQWLSVAIGALEAMLALVCIGALAARGGLMATVALEGIGVAHCRPLVWCIDGHLRIGYNWCTDESLT